MNIKLMLLTILLSVNTYAEFSNESDLTVILNGGNTEQETWNTKTLNTYLLNKNIFKIGGHYSYGKADGELNTRNWDINSRYERVLFSDWSIFGAAQRESDFFAQLDYRWNYDIGGIYNLLKADKHKLNFEFGYRRTLESDLGGNKSNGSKIRLYSEYTRQHNESVSFKLWVEALPNLSESDDWQINFGPSLNVNLSKILTVKLGYSHKYDNQVAIGTKKSDYQYTTSIIAKF